MYNELKQLIKDWKLEADSLTFVIKALPDGVGKRELTATHSRLCKCIAEAELLFLDHQIKKDIAPPLQKNHVSGSLPVDLLRKAYNAGMVEAIKRRCAEEDNYEYKQVSFEMWLNSVTEADGNGP